MPVGDGESRGLGAWKVQGVPGPFRVPESDGAASYHHARRRTARLRLGAVPLGMSRCPASNRPLTESERRREFLEAGLQQPLDKNENPSTLSHVAALLFFVLGSSGQSGVFTTPLYSTTGWGGCQGSRRHPKKVFAAYKVPGCAAI